MIRPAIRPVIRPAIRPATLVDLEPIVAIERASGTAPHWSLDEYRRILSGEGPVRRCLLVTDALSGFSVGKVVGDLGELESVAVAASARRMGLGRALCQAAVAWCRSQGALAVELEVRAESLEAQRLYQRIGFTAVGSRPAYYEDPTEDAVLMRLHLQATDLKP